MSEKRIFERRQLIYFMKVIDLDKDQPIGSLVDISQEGIMLMCETPVETGKDFRVKVLLKKGLGSRDHLCFEVRCKWCNKKSFGDYYDAGFALLKATPEDLQEIEDIIQKLCF